MRHHNHRLTTVNLKDNDVSDELLKDLEASCILNSRMCHARLLVQICGADILADPGEQVQSPISSIIPSFEEVIFRVQPNTEHRQLYNCALTQGQF